MEGENATFLAYYALLFQVKTQLKHKKICMMYGAGAVTDQTC